MNGLEGTMPVEEYSRQIEVHGRDFPPLLAIVRLLEHCRKVDPERGVRVLTSLWHTYRVMQKDPEVFDGEQSLSLEGHAALFDFYFDREGDWLAVENQLLASINKRLDDSDLPTFFRAVAMESAQFTQLSHELVKRKSKERHHEQVGSGAGSDSTEPEISEGRGEQGTYAVGTDEVNGAGDRDGSRDDADGAEGSSRVGRL
jgi:hypothetical protein